MHQKQLPKIPELPKRVVASAHRLRAFLPGDPDSNMGLLDHTYVIRAVPDAKRNPGTALLRQGNNLHFLSR